MTKIVVFLQVGGISISAFLMAITGVILGITTWETASLRERENDATDYKSRVDIRTRRWRSERNFWIVLCAFILWLSLHRLRGAIKEKD